MYQKQTKEHRSHVFIVYMFQVHPSQEYIKWDHYHKVFKYEENSLTKVCPKLTKHHFELNNLSKMKVKYAVQVKRV